MEEEEHKLDKEEGRKERHYLHASKKKIKHSDFDLCYAISTLE